MIDTCHACGAPFQGYVATIRHKNAEQFVKFGGGVTSDFMEASVYESPAEAMETAREHYCPSLFHVAGFVAIDGNCELHAC